MMALERLYTAPAAADTDNGLSVTASPAQVALTDLAPGVPQSAQVAVQNTGTRAVVLTVQGELDTHGSADPADALHVDLAGCANPWTGLPATPTCQAGQVGATGDALAGIPLEVGANTWVLITAGLSAGAGDGAQGQTWTAHMTLTAAATSPEPAPALAFTGADPTSALLTACLAVAAGTVLVRATRAHRAQRRNR